MKDLPRYYLILLRNTSFLEIHTKNMLCHKHERKTIMEKQNKISEFLLSDGIYLLVLHCVYFMAILLLGCVAISLLEYTAISFLNAELLFILFWVACALFILALIRRYKKLKINGGTSDFERESAEILFTLSIAYYVIAVPMGASILWGENRYIAALYILFVIILPLALFICNYLTVNHRRMNAQKIVNMFKYIAVSYFVLVIFYPLVYVSSVADINSSMASIFISNLLMAVVASLSLFIAEHDK